MPKRQTALTKSVPIHGPLAAFLRSKSMPRTQVSKKIWAYIKKHNLQDPKERRVIRPDAKLATVIGKKPINMFAMTKAYNKYIG